MSEPKPQSHWAKIDGVLPEYAGPLTISVSRGYEAVALGGTWLNVRSMVKFTCEKLAPKDGDGPCWLKVFVVSRNLAPEVYMPRSYWGRLWFGITGKKEFRYFTPGDAVVRFNEGPIPDWEDDLYPDYSIVRKCRAGKEKQL